MQKKCDKRNLELLISIKSESTYYGGRIAVIAKAYIEII